MNETSCDIHDVTRAASDLVAAGCSIGMAHIPDGIERLRFGSIVSAYADEIIQAVDEGVISAWEGLQQIGAEHAELISKSLFYTQNGINILAGGAQIKAGVVVTGASWGVGVIPGALLVSHGANNIAEGAANIITAQTCLPLKDLFGAAIRRYLGIATAAIWRTTQQT